MPSKVKAWPTRPEAKVAPFWSVPLFVPIASRQSPSPRHQLTRPEGGGAGQWRNNGQQRVGANDRAIGICHPYGVISRLGWLRTQKPERGNSHPGKIGSIEPPLVAQRRGASDGHAKGRGGTGKDRLTGRL